VLDFRLRVLPPAMEWALKTALVAALASYWFTAGQEHYRSQAGVPFRFYSTLKDFSPKKMNPYWQTADWLNAHVDRKAVIAVQEAGFIPFLTGLNAIDTYGLCNARLAHMAGPRNRLGRKLTWDPADPGVQYILSRRPDVIVVGPATDWAQAPQRFIGNYLLTASPQEGMNVFRREDSAFVR